MAATSAAALPVNWVGGGWIAADRGGFGSDVTITHQRQLAAASDTVCAVPRALPNDDASAFSLSLLPAEDASRKSRQGTGQRLCGRPLLFSVAVNEACTSHLLLLHEIYTSRSAVSTVPPIYYHYVPTCE